MSPDRLSKKIREARAEVSVSFIQILYHVFLCQDRDLNLKFYKMDFLDTSKLLHTSHLDKVLEGLMCNEDSNAKDSIYSKSTTLDAEESCHDYKSIFGESYDKSDISQNDSVFPGYGKGIDDDAIFEELGQKPCKLKVFAGFY